jgi:membrane protease YdiL (CAAX protease family)
MTAASSTSRSATCSDTSCDCGDQRKSLSRISGALLLIICFNSRLEVLAATFIRVLYKSWMTTPSGLIVPAPPPPLPALPNESTPKLIRRRWFELCLVLLIAFTGPIFSSLNVLLFGLSAVPQVSNLRWVGQCVQEAAILILLAYVLSRRAHKFADLGLRWSIRDVGVGVLVVLLGYSAYFLGGTLLQTIHYIIYSAYARPINPRTFYPHVSLMMVLFSFLNPFFEELIVRAYLMTEIMELTGSSALAVILSVGLQFVYHLYYGWFGAVALSCQFLVFSLYYARWRRALPIVVAHGIVDLYAVFRLW